MAKTKATSKTRRSSATSTRKPAHPPKQILRPGDYVRVRPGVRDPDFEDCVIGRWSGRVVATGENDDGEVLCRIKWDLATLKKIPPEVREKADEDALDYTKMDLFPENVELIEAPAHSVNAQLSEDDQDDRIRKALGLRAGEDHPNVDEDTLLTYYLYLQEHLTFPFEATHRQESGDWGYKRTRVTVVGLLDPDESPEFDSGCGIFCKTRVGRRSPVAPLEEIEVRKSVPQHRLVDDYSVWFANNR